MTPETTASNDDDKQSPSPATKGDDGKRAEIASKNREILRPRTAGGDPPPALGADIPAPPSPYDYYPDQLTLYGIKLNPDKGETTDFVFDNRVLKLEVKATDGKEERNEASIAVIYGYSYQGHCYRLDKTRMYIINNRGSDANGCGFSSPYFMWNIRARTSIMEISLNYDLAEVLILDSNLPGNRAPNTYGNDMQLAHRGGKLNRPGGP